MGHLEDEWRHSCSCRAPSARAPGFHSVQQKRSQDFETSRTTGLVAKRRLSTMRTMLQRGNQNFRDSAKMYAAHEKRDRYLYQSLCSFLGPAPALGRNRAASRSNAGSSRRPCSTPPNSGCKVKSRKPPNASDVERTDAKLRDDSLMGLPEPGVRVPWATFALIDRMHATL